MDDQNAVDKKPDEKTRNKIVYSLQNAYAHNLIEAEEFEKRLHDATYTNSSTALMELANDIPIVNEQPEENTPYKNTNNDKVKKSSILVSIFSGNDRSGSWRPAKNLKILSIMGGSNLDFTHAKLAPGTTKINITCIMGGVDMKVPEGVNVEINGLPIMGGIENKCHEYYGSNAPTLKIRALVIMGGVNVKKSN